MRILLSTYGSRGDVEPLAGLAVALKALGAEAVVSAPGDQELVDLLARAGVAYAPAFMPVREWIAWAARSGLGLPGFAKVMVPAQYKAIAEAAEGCDAIMSTGLFPSAAAAQMVAEKMGLRHWHVALCPLSLPSHHHKPFPRPGYPLPPEVTDNRALWRLNAEHMNALFGEAVNAQRAAMGLPLLDDVRGPVLTDRPLLASDPVLWPWRTTELCTPIHTGAWMLPDARPLPDQLRAFLDAGDPPVYVGFGSIALQSAKDAVGTAIAAIRAQGHRVVLARGWADAGLADDGNDCIAIGEINQQALFPRVAAVIHHGGAGSTTTAARAGAPQVIVPQIVDQPFWAARVAGLGVGVAHEGSTPTFESLSAALRQALTLKAQAREIAPTIKADGAMAAAKVLLDAL